MFHSQALWLERMGNQGNQPLDWQRKWRSPMLRAAPLRTFGIFSFYAGDLGPAPGPAKVEVHRKRPRPRPTNPRLRANCRASGRGPIGDEVGVAEGHLQRSQNHLTAGWKIPPIFRAGGHLWELCKRRITTQKTTNLRMLQLRFLGLETSQGFFEAKRNPIRGQSP